MSLSKECEDQGHYPSLSGILSSCSSACCCVICMLDCSCQGCVLFKHNNVRQTFLARKLYQSCMTDTLRMTKDEKKNYFLTKLQSFQVKVTPKKSFKYVFVVGKDDNTHVVCRRGFRRAYNLSTWYLDDLIVRLKKGQVHSIAELNYKSAVSSADVSDRRLALFAESFGINITNDNIGSLRLSSSIESLMCASWMQYYFSLVGDHAPNTDGEIHLEPIPKSEVYKEYVFDMENFGGDVHSPLSLPIFREIWRDVYPHVKIRKYKSSCGHCNLCTTLSEKRRKHKDSAGREEVTNLFALHRMSTMGERRTYYDRRLQAELNPSIYLSSIADGMQQNHCLLPWYGNGKHPGQHHVKQHLQGVYMHGDTMTIYRTFANVGGGANLAIHTWLLSLEDYARRHNWRLPKVIYHQIDGGPENANKEFLALCSLLVASGLVDKIVLTRLPVGHTHEDIDALFALIWKKLRDEHIYTPAEFSKLICEALKKKVKVNVVDVFCVPDYKSLLADCIDSSLSRFSKEEWAQLQFIMESCDVGDDHPMGVKTSYRAYAQDSFIEIVEDETNQSASGLVPQECVVKTHPLPGEAPLNILTKFPTSEVKPAPFIAGSHEMVSEVSQRMQAQFARNKQSVAEEWKAWSSDSFPQSDDVQHYVASSGGVIPAKSIGTKFELKEDDSPGVYLPFRKQLFGRLGMSESEVLPRSRGTRERLTGVNMRVVESTPCVLHSGHNNVIARRVPSREVVKESDGTVPVLRRRGVLNAPYPGREEQRQMRQETRRRNAIARASTAQNVPHVDTTDVQASSDTSAVEDVPHVDTTDVQASSDTSAVEDVPHVDTTDVQASSDTSAVENVPHVDTTDVQASESTIHVKKRRRMKNMVAPIVKRKSKCSRGVAEVIVVTEEWQDSGRVNANNILHGKRKRPGSSRNTHY